MAFRKHPWLPWKTLNAANLEALGASRLAELLMQITAKKKLFWLNIA